MHPSEKASNLMAMARQVIQNNLTLSFPEENKLFGRKPPRPVVRLNGVEKAAYALCEKMILVEISKLTITSKDPYHSHNESFWHRCSDYWNEVHQFLKLGYGEG